MRTLSNEEISAVSGGAPVNSGFSNFFANIRDILLAPFFFLAIRDFFFPG